MECKSLHIFADSIVDHNFLGILAYCLEKALQWMGTHAVASYWDKFVIELL